MSYKTKDLLKKLQALHKELINKRRQLEINYLTTAAYCGKTTPEIEKVLQATVGFFDHSSNVIKVYEIQQRKEELEREGTHHNLRMFLKEDSKVKLLDLETILEDSNKLEENFAQIQNKLETILPQHIRIDTSFGQMKFIILDMSYQNLRLNSILQKLKKILVEIFSSSGVDEKETDDKVEEILYKITVNVRSIQQELGKIVHHNLQSLEQLGVKQYYAKQYKVISCIQQKLDKYQCNILLNREAFEMDKIDEDFYDYLVQSYDLFTFHRDNILQHIQELQRIEGGGMKTRKKEIRTQKNQTSHKLKYQHNIQKNV